MLTLKKIIKKILEQFLKLYKKSSNYIILNNGFVAQIRLRICGII